MSELLKDFVAVSIVEYKDHIVDVGLLVFDGHFNTLMEYEIRTRLEWLEEPKGLYLEKEAIEILKNIVNGKLVLCWTNINDVLDKFGIHLYQRLQLKDFFTTNGLNVELSSRRAHLRCRELYVLLKGLQNARVEITTN